MMKIRLSGEYNLKSQEFIDSSFGVYSFSNEDYLLLISGGVYIDGAKNDAGKIIKLFTEYNHAITEKVSGLYILLIYNKKTKTLSIFHDMSSSPITLYYTTFQDTIFISTSLKHLLLTSKIKRQINNYVVPEFLRKGFIDGESTLIQYINKIKLFHALVITGDGCKQIAVSYYRKKYTVEDACAKWKDALDKSIDCILSDIDSFGITLSGGYDTNYIANHVNCHVNNKIPAFCVGGEKGGNEIPLVEEIVNEYENLTLHTSLTNRKTFNSFPDIVWRLEGSMYEIGVFLQYELAKLVSSNGCEHIICGECADEAMDERFTLSDSAFLLNDSSDSQSKETHYIQYAAFLFVLKKNGILENSFGVESHFPYLNIEFMNIANSIKDVNGQDKRYHRVICSREVPESISTKISHSPGTTHGQSLFKDIDEVKRFYRWIENSAIYKKHPVKITQSSPHDNLLSKLKLSIKNILHYHYDEKKMQNFYLSLEEKKIRCYLYYAYLIIFEDLFISGKYDSFLKDDGINISLDEISLH